jgi:hypothetical protein
MRPRRSSLAAAPALAALSALSMLWTACKTAGYDSKRAAVVAAAVVAMSSPEHADWASNLVTGRQQADPPYPTRRSWASRSARAACTRSAS